MSVGIMLFSDDVSKVVSFSSSSLGESSSSMDVSCSLTMRTDTNFG